MAVASTATKHNRMTTVTPKQVADAKQAAIEAHWAAYGVRPVPQPDGSTLDLCLRGRLDRAFAMMAEADDATRAKLQPAIKALSAQCEAAYREATVTAASYAELALAAGQQPDELAWEQCTCEGCQIGVNQAAYFAAMADLRGAVFDLLLPRDIDDALPALASMDEPAIQRSMQRIADAQRKYAAACAAFGQRPAWDRVCGAG